MIDPGAALPMVAVPVPYLEISDVVRLLTLMVINGPKAEKILERIEKPVRSQTDSS